jgi:hypothetical protein
MQKTPLKGTGIKGSMHQPDVRIKSMMLVSLFLMLSLATHTVFAQKSQLQKDGSYVSANAGFARAYSALSGLLTTHGDPSSLINWNGSVIAHHFIIPRYVTFGMGIGHMWSNEPGVHAVPLVFDLRIMTMQKVDAIYLLLQYAHAEPLGRVFYSANYATFGIGYQRMVYGKTFNLELGMHSRVFAREPGRLQAPGMPFLQISSFNASIGYKLFQKEKRKYEDE